MATVIGERRPSHTTNRETQEQATTPGHQTTMKAIVQDNYGSADVLELGRSTGPRSGTTTCWFECERPPSTLVTGRSWAACRISPARCTGCAGQKPVFEARTWPGRLRPSARA